MSLARPFFLEIASFEVRACSELLCEPSLIVFVVFIKMHSSLTETLILHNDLSFLYAWIVLLKPSINPILGAQPIPLKLLESISLRGVPSG